MDEVALERTAAGVAQQGHGPGGVTTFGDLGRNQRFPVGPSEHVVAERQRIAKVVLSMIHGARRQQVLRPYWIANCASITSSSTFDNA